MVDLSRQGLILLTFLSIAGMISFAPWSLEREKKLHRPVLIARPAPVRKAPASLPRASTGSSGPQAPPPVQEQKPLKIAPRAEPVPDQAVLRAARQRYLDNVYLLAKLVHGEARGEPYVGQVAVGAVVMNRIESPIFPNTLAGVIYQPGAFDAVSDGQMNLPPDSDSVRAARDAIGGWDPTGGCLYYYNPAKATSRWIWSRPIILSIGDHHFAR